MKTVYALIGAVAFSAAVHAQAPKPAAAAAAAKDAKEVVLTATSANVKETGTPVKIRIFRWSDDAERTPLISALTAPPPAPPRAGGAAGGRGGAAAGRGGGGGRGGRGGDAAPVTPIAAFTAALQKAPTIGYLWTDDVTGYSIKYATRTAQPDGSERIVLATDRRLGAYSPDWTPNAGGTPTDYEFTVLDLRLDAKGGEGKSSLTTKIVADNATKQLGLENYAAAPTILQNIKR
jgi:hypothetical protein